MLMLEKLETFPNVLMLYYFKNRNITLTLANAIGLPLF